jgi:hypothetical protein
MLAFSDSNLIVAGLATGGLVLAALWRLVGWVREAPVKPDPWDHAIELKLQAPETTEACPHCSTPQSPGAWFCPHCGKAVGPYNNLMPYVQVFSEGEVFRNGTSGQFRNRPLILIGYFLISLGMFSVLAPIFWFSLWRNFRRSGSPPAAVQDQKSG